MFLGAFILGHGWYINSTLSLSPRLLLSLFLCSCELSVWSKVSQWQWQSSKRSRRLRLLLQCHQTMLWITRKLMVKPQHQMIPKLLLLCLSLRVSFACVHDDQEFSLCFWCFYASSDYFPRKKKIIKSWDFIPLLKGFLFPRLLAIISLKIYIYFFSFLCSSFLFYFLTYLFLK